jgi:SAM-dependent methyltransferase
LRLHRSRTGRLLAPLWLTAERRQAFDRISGEIVVHDLSKGIPAASGTVDAVYHSHVLEHIDRDRVPGFLAEVHRVLRPRGVHRICVPNFERYVRDYLASLEYGRANHDETLVPLIAQSVQREAYGTSLQSPLRRRIENLLLGDARKRGQTHQWAYDPLNLRQILESAGYVDFEIVTPTASRIHGWSTTGLDTDADGTVHKPGSIWAEAVKP